MKNKYYDGTRIDSTDADYRIIFGDRSNGKTYHVLLNGLVRWWESGERDMTAIIRRWNDDFIGENSSRTCYDSLNFNGEGVNMVTKITKNKYSSIHYWGGRFYLYTINDNGEEVRTDKYIGIAFSLNTWEHSKGGQFPFITTILFDEFITRSRYLEDEFVIFSNVLSTIIRKREDKIVIYMCGNTINKYTCPYFSEMGLTRVDKMKRGEIDIYQYGDSLLKVAVEYTSPTNVKTKASKYFAFDNPRLKMITGQGDDTWELLLYPHCPHKFYRTDIVFTFFIIHDLHVCQCEVVEIDGATFVYIHRKSTPLKDEVNDLIYTRDPSHLPNHVMNIYRPVDDITKKILSFFSAEKIFYQDNDVGEIVNAYLLSCKVSRA